MNHYYQNIHGWFNYEQLYSDMVSKYSDGAHFVEVGSWVGRSACYLGVEIVNSGKKIKLDCVDTWLGAPELLNEDVIVNGTLYSDFMRNIEPIRSVVTAIRLTSTQASHLYEDLSLDFVFLDADHTEEGIKADLKCWYPKIKIGGVFAGHDWDYPQITLATNNFFKFRGEYEVIQPNIWVHHKKS